MQGIPARGGRWFLAGELGAAGLVIAVGLHLGEGGLDMLTHQVAPLGRAGFEQRITALARRLGQDGGGVVAWAAGRVGSLSVHAARMLAA